MPATALPIHIDDTALLEPWSTEPLDIIEYEIAPAIADGLVVTFEYDHPERGLELRHLIPEAAEQTRAGRVVVTGRDRDHGGRYRSFRLDRIRAAKAEAEEIR